MRPCGRAATSRGLPESPSAVRPAWRSRGGDIENAVHPCESEVQVVVAHNPTDDPHPAMRVCRLLTGPEGRGLRGDRGRAIDAPDAHLRRDHRATRVGPMTAGLQRRPRLSTTGRWLCATELMRGQRIAVNPRRKEVNTLSKKRDFAAGMTGAAIGTGVTAGAAGACVGTAICPVVGTAAGWVVGTLSSMVLGRRKKKD
jgi:hypothetical protein